MVINITLPFGKEDSIKNLVFTILTKEYPLKIIELTNFIRKRYGKSVTFQAVRKAVLELTEDGVVEKNKTEFSINKGWVKKSKSVLDELYETLTKEKISPKGVESIKGEVSVFTFDSLNEMVQFWEDIIDDWFKNFKKGDYNINCWQGAHVWEGLFHIDRERRIMGQLKKKGIISYAISTGSTPLDRNLWKFYKSIGLKIRLYPSSSSFDKSYYVGTYGDIIVQAHYPPKLVKLLDSFFKKNKSLNNLDLNELSEIVNLKTKIQLTVIKNLGMAKQINKSIISQIE